MDRRIIHKLEITEYTRFHLSPKLVYGVTMVCGRKRNDNKRFNPLFTERKDAESMANDLSFIIGMEVEEVANNDTVVKVINQYALKANNLVKKEVEP